MPRVSDWHSVAPAIYYGGTGQAKHHYVFQAMRDNWVSRHYVDDIPVCLRLDLHGAADAARAARLRGFAELVDSGVCVIGLWTGGESDLRAEFAKYGVTLSPAVELVEVPDVATYDPTIQPFAAPPSGGKRN